MTWQSLWQCLRSHLASPSAIPSVIGPDPQQGPGAADVADQVEKAVGEVLGSLAIRVRVMDRDHLVMMAQGISKRAALEKERSHYLLAESLCQRAWDLLEKTVPPDHPQCAEVLETYASILHQEAELLEAHAAAIRANKRDERISGTPPREPDTRIQKK